MSRKGLARHYGELANLQDLGAAERRHHLAEAVTQTDKCAVRQDELANNVSEASEKLDAVFSGPTLCIDNLLLAASNLNHCEEAKLASRQALKDAQTTENNARIDWSRAQQTADWFAIRNRELIRQEARKLDEKAVDRAISLRLSIGEGNNS